MKRITTMFAIITMLVLSAFGQQATTVAPAQTSKPAKKAVTSQAAPTATVQSTAAATVQSAGSATAPVSSVSAGQAAAAPISEATPAASVSIASTAQTPIASGGTAQTAPAIAGQGSNVKPTSTPRPATAGATLSGQQTNVAATSPTPKEPDYVSEKGFKGKVFEIKYRDPNAIRQAVASLGSGFRGAEIRANDEFKTLTVRDFPENIMAIEEAIKRLDTPQAPRPDIEFRIQVLIGSTTPAAGEDVPDELRSVVNQLKETLKYKNYSLMVSALHRTKDGGGVSNHGVVESKLFNTISVPAGNQIFYDYNANRVNLDSSTSAGTTVQIGGFEFSLRIPLVLGSATDPKIQYQSVGFHSPVSLREGEKVVVGTTTMGDKGLVVVLTAKVNK
jgi:hypothetical protein